MKPFAYRGLGLSMWLCGWGVVAGSLAGGCSPNPPGTIADLENYPQDCAAYLPAEAGPLLDAAQQKAMVERLRRTFFAPWHQDKPPEKAEVLRDFERFDRADLFGPDMHPRPAGWAKALLAGTDMDGYGKGAARAITLRNCDLRELPTREPGFEDFGKAGGGYPFDLLQATALWAGTPLLVAHVTPGEWAYVVSPLARGWLPVQDLGRVSDELAAEWERQDLAAVTADNVAIVDDQGHPRFVAHVGTLLPLAGTDAKGLQVWAPAGQADGSAIRVTAHVETAKACRLPMPMTPANLAAIGNVMLGQRYGWGGMYENRDCSSMLHDLFVPFGLYLPRNSGDQARAGRRVPLGHLPPPQREAAILRDGAPWLTVLRAPGHVALYIGQRDGRAMILHNFWGIATSHWGREGRFVVGRCGITTLRPGIELANVARPRGDLRARLDSMTLLAAPAEGKP